jgi:hypothetical protein
MLSMIVKKSVMNSSCILLDFLEDRVCRFDLLSSMLDHFSSGTGWYWDSTKTNIRQMPFCSNNHFASMSKEGQPSMSFGLLAILFRMQHYLVDVAVIFV